MRRRLVALGAVALFTYLAACAAEAEKSSTDESDLTGLERPQQLGPGESVLMLLGTNDMHGGFGRLPQLAGYVGAARAHLTTSYGDRANLVVLDAGDATQGTLLSNYSEGLLAVRAMSAIGYTAAVAGNHGFDFGPIGWTKDQCLASDTTCDPLESLERSVRAASFPFLGANVTRKTTGKTLDFLPPYVLVPFQGRNVAVLGLENHFTDRTTVPENVVDLAFGEGKSELAKNVESLWASGQADVFVLVMHEGDADAASMRQFLEGLPKRSDGQPLIDAAIAGHSHRINDAVASGIPYIQSGANGELFGIIELVAKKDAVTGRLGIARERTRKRAAIPIAERPTGFLLSPVVKSAEVAAIVAEGNTEVGPIAQKHLVTAPTPVSRDGGRTADSEIGNLIADMMLRATGAEVALINGGDVRDDLPAGEIIYENLFRVLPKNLGLVTVKTMETKKLVANMRLSVESCGRRGALQFAGVKVLFTRDCARAVNGVDPSASLVALVLPNGDRLFERKNGADVYLRTTVNVATSDFVMSGGAGYNGFLGVVPSSPPLALRDEVAKGLEALGTLDRTTFARGRYVAQ